MNPTFLLEEHTISFVHLLLDDEYSNWIKLYRLRRYVNTIYSNAMRCSFDNVTGQLILNPEDTVEIKHAIVKKMELAFRGTGAGVIFSWVYGNSAFTTVLNSNTSMALPTDTPLEDITLNSDLIIKIVTMYICSRPPDLKNGSQWFLSPDLVEWRNAPQSLQIQNNPLYLEQKQHSKLSVSTIKSALEAIVSRMD